ncbi:MAG: hypothetical protein Q8N88_05305 [Nanoarchaeota archaeon]|nr:hypothetical protein [Nanoarchaeota archaeon]
MKWWKSLVLIVVWVLFASILIVMAKVESPKEKVILEVDSFQQELNSEIIKIVSNPPEFMIEKQIEPCANQIITMTWSSQDSIAKYSITATREKDKLKTFGINLWINQEISYIYEDVEKGIDSEKAKQIVEIVAQYTNLKDLKVKNIEGGEKFELKKYSYSKQPEQLSDGRVIDKYSNEFIGSAGKAIVFNEYKKSNFNPAYKSEWVRNTYGAQKCYNAQFSTANLIFDYDSDGNTDVKETIVSDQYGSANFKNRSLIFFKLLTHNFQFSDAEWIEKNKEEQNDYYKALAGITSAFARIYIPHSNEYVETIHENSAYCNVLVGLENNEYKVEVGVRDILEVSIIKK